jgi:hypothetical protein
MNPMKPLFTLLMLAAVMLSPLVASAEEQLPVGVRSVAAVGNVVPPQLRDAKVWRFAADGARVSVGTAELKLDVAARRLGITMSLAL